MSRDQEDRRRAFTGLLAHPVVDRHRHPELFALIRHPRHRPVLTEWFAARLGYRLVVTNSVARLFRLPVAGAVTMPRRPTPPSRRVLVLAVLAAAVAEDAEDVTTTQDLSDRVRALTQHEEVELAPYDPDHFTERQLFARAVALLADSGALRPVTTDSEGRREGWARRKDEVGGAYEVRRELLLRLVDPAALVAALDHEGERDDLAATTEPAVRQAVMRRLIELPVCLWDDLTAVERAYLTGQRHRVLAWCTEMTGWVAEQRAEGIALIVANGDDTDTPFPGLRAADFIVLMFLGELLIRQDEQGRIDVRQMDRAAIEVRIRHSRALTQEFQTDQAVRERAVGLLQVLDLLRPAVEPGLWQLTPAAARYRNPKVVCVTAGFEETGD